MKIVRYLVCRLKEIERVEVIEGLTNKTKETWVDFNGCQATREVTEPRALVLKLMKIFRDVMFSKAARSWKQIGSYMELLLAFGVQSSADIENETPIQNKPTWSRDSIGYRVGMTEYLRSNFLATLGDFILQDNSPLHAGVNDYRIQMGNYYAQPEFDKGLLLCTLLMSEQEI